MNAGTPTQQVSKPFTTPTIAPTDRLTISAGTRDQ